MANEVTRRKSTAKAKLKVTNQQERIHLWNLLGNPPKVAHEAITRIISEQLDIKLGLFMQKELDSVLRKIKNIKAVRFDDILLQHFNAIYNQNPIDKWTKGCILPFPKKGNLRLALTSIAVKIYYTTAQNPKLRTYLGRTKMASRGIDPQHHKFWLSNSWRCMCKKPTSNNMSILPRPLTPFTEERRNKFYSPTAYQKKLSQP